jgi:hypothetical protein
MLLRKPLVAPGELDRTAHLSTRRLIAAAFFILAIGSGLHLGRDTPCQISSEEAMPQRPSNLMSGADQYLLRAWRGMQAINKKEDRSDFRLGPRWPPPCVAPLIAGM